MNALLKPIAAPIRRPDYDNASIGDESAWLQANSKALRTWWNECGQGVGPLTEADYRGFCRSQREIQIYLRNKAPRLHA